VIQTKIRIAGFFILELPRRWIMRRIECVECGSFVPIPEDVMANEILFCPDCGVELEVISLEPLSLALAPEVEEDWGE
jgi:alpha-aminoadipate carrier protein LysW